jgi:hypothetical protein
MTWPANTCAENTRRLPSRSITLDLSTKLSRTTSTRAIIVTSAGDPLQPGSSLCCYDAPTGERIATLLGVLSWFERTVLAAQLKTMHILRLLHIATHGFFLPTSLGEENPTYSSIIIQIEHNFE